MALKSPAEIGAYFAGRSGETNWGRAARGLALSASTKSAMTKRGRAASAASVARLDCAALGERPTGATSARLLRLRFDAADERFGDALLLLAVVVVDVVGAVGVVLGDLARVVFTFTAVPRLNRMVLLREILVRAHG